MKLEYYNFGGTAGFYLQKMFPGLCSDAFLKYQLMARERSQRKYIKDFLESRDGIPKPKLISIETINRCNNDCAFCNASREQETRPFAKIDDGLFHEIID